VPSSPRRRGGLAETGGETPNLTRWGTRDFAGYGPAPPEFTWPSGATLAVNIIINYEEGAERNAQDGDRTREPFLEGGYEVPAGTRELFGESSVEYGSRVGVWRLLELLDRYEFPATVFACGLALERSPTVSRAFADHGFDFVGHGYRWLPHTGMTVDEEHANISRCSTAIKRVTGERPIGWFTRPPNTVHTRPLLADEGFLYDSGAVNDDIPYFDAVDDRPFLVIPYTLDVNDTRFVKNEFITSSDFSDYCIDAFNTLWSESERHSRMLSIGLHSRIIGRPGRFAGLERVLRHIAGHERVWVARRNEIATFWAREFGPPGLWNWPPPEGQ
jgi:peptidoglycan/xylan/chitin deacetylase (PgdA/CDA1 family)